MQDFVSILKYILQSNVINFILMLIILGWIVSKLNLGKLFDSSAAQVEQGIKKSDDEKAKAKVLLDEAKSLIERLPQDVKDLKQSSEEKGEIFRREIENNADNIISNLNHNIDSTIEVEEKKFSNVLTDKTTAASIELARLHMIKLLEQDPELHNKFIQYSLDELDKVEI